MDSALGRTSPTGAGALSRLLARARFMRLTTFRKSGEPVATPVWFALAGDTVYVVTDDPSGKLKRIRNNGRVRLAPSNFRGTPNGDETEAVATVITDPAERSAAERALRQHYGWQWRLFTWFSDRFRKHNGQPVRHAFLKIVAA